MGRLVLGKARIVPGEAVLILGLGAVQLGLARVILGLALLQLFRPGLNFLLALSQLLLADLVGEQALRKGQHGGVIGLLRQIQRLCQLAQLPHRGEERAAAAVGIIGIGPGVAQSQGRGH